MTTEVQSRRSYTSLVRAIVKDVILIDAALMGSILLNEAWFKGEPMRIHAGDLPVFALLTALWLATAAVLRPYNSKTGWQISSQYVSTFAIFIIVGGVSRIPLPVLAMSAAIAGVFIATSRLRPKPRTNRTKLKTTPPKTILVIGDSRLAHATAAKLTTQNYRVKILGTNESTGDHRDTNAIIHATKGAQAVLYLADVFSNQGESEEGSILESNLHALRVAAGCAKAAQARRFIYASSCSVYGISEEAQNEESILQPTCLGSRIKAAAEQELNALQDINFRPTILRFANLYNAEGCPLLETIVKNFLQNKQQLTDRSHPFVDIEDAAKAICLTLSAPADAVWGQTYNVGSASDCRTPKEITKLGRRTTPGAIDFSKIETRLGFRATSRLDETITKLIESFDGEEGKTHSSGFAPATKRFEDSPESKLCIDQTMLY